MYLIFNSVFSLVFSSSAGNTYKKRATRQFYWHFLCCSFLGFSFRQKKMLYNISYDIVEKNGLQQKVKSLSKSHSFFFFNDGHFIQIFQRDIRTFFEFLALNLSPIGTVNFNKAPIINIFELEKMSAVWLFQFPLWSKCKFVRMFFRLYFSVIFQLDIFLQ